MIINDNLNDFILNIKNGNVACFKTDTIWGLSALANDGKAIKKLYTFKQRNVNKPFIFLIKKDEDLSRFVEYISPTQQKLINAFWPGPLTIIFKAKKDVDFLKFYKENATIALRMPNNELCQQILSQLNYPLPSTSVNIEGQYELNNFEEISSTFAEYNFCIYIDNSFDYPENRQSSTIVMCRGENVEILREGSITKEQIFEVLNK